MCQLRRHVSVTAVKPLGRLWMWIESRARLADAALAIVLLGSALVLSKVSIDLIARDPFEPMPSMWAAVAGVSAMTIPLAFRRRAPLVVLLVSTAGFVELGFVLGNARVTSVTLIAYCLAVYSAATQGRPGRRNWACAIGLVAVTAIAVRDVSDAPPDLPLLARLSEVGVTVALVAAIWALGSALGSGRRRAQQLQQRTFELEREREDNARRAVFDERVRIARELHDVVAHHVSMMGVQAGAARVVLARDPVKATVALSAIEASSRQAVTELHQLLGFLRQAGDDDDTNPRPSLGQLPRLVASMGDSDLTVQVRVEGDVRALPATVELSAYRIVQEALTNTLKHSAASRADVCLRYEPTALEVAVIDRGPIDGSRQSGAGGLGLIGMRERAVLHGGELTAGPDTGGGFAVRVRLPTPTDGAL